VRRTFLSQTDARMWEEKVLRRIKAVKRAKWLNKSNRGKDFCNDDEETRQKMRASILLRVEKGIHIGFNNTSNNPAKLEVNKKKLIERNRKAYENGNHSFCKDRHPNKSDEGRKRCSNSTRIRLSNGNHPFRMFITCEFCGKVYQKNHYYRYHGVRCKNYAP